MADNNIPAINLRRQHQNLKKELDPVIQDVLASGWYLLGQRLEQFEQNFAQYIGVKFCVGVATGTDALTLSLKALGLGKGDNVIVPANVYPTAFGVALSGVTLKLVDVDQKTHSLDPKKLEQAIDNKTKAIIAVHLYGNPVNLEEIQQIAKNKNIFLVEDCAQSAGAVYQDKKVGSFGDVACFSFYPTKNLGADGDGGAILTSDEELFRKLKLYRMYGEELRYKSVLVGHNSRLDEIQAAILAVKLKHLDEWNKRRQDIARQYEQGFKDLPVKLVELNKGTLSVYHLFIIQTPKREELKRYLTDKGIGVGIYYPHPIHLTESFADLGYHMEDFPVAEKISQETLSLPIYPELTDEEVSLVINSVSNFFK